MVSKEQIENFYADKRIAVVGASSTGKGFGNQVIQELARREFAVYPVHPHAENINGLKVSKSLKELPDGVSTLFIALKPADAEKVLVEAINAGMQQVWVQQRSETVQMLELAKKAGINYVYGQCILMFLKDTSFPHRVHRFFSKISGNLPV